MPGRLDSDIGLEAWGVGRARIGSEQGSIAQDLVALNIVPDGQIARRVRDDPPVPKSRLGAQLIAP